MQVTQLQTGAATSYPRTETYTYEASTGLLTGQVVNGTGGAPVYLNLSYDYSRGNSYGSTSGKTGQVTKVTDNLNANRTRTYDFDALGRLKTAKGGLAAGATSVTANWTQNYAYDRYGNKTGVATGTGTLNVDELGLQVPADGLPSVSIDDTSNRVTQTSGWYYDVTGNLLRGQDASGAWQRFEYDAAGRLKLVKDDAGTTVYETYTYGATRERLMTETSSGRTYYVWGGSSVLAEYTESTSGTTPNYSKAYIYAGSRLLSTFTKTSATTESKELHHPDRLGTKLVTDGSGTSNLQSTLPFGTSFNAEGGQRTNQAFTSYDRSASTGLDYAVNRTYSKGQSRFTQVDPLAMGAVSLGNPQSNNLYAYTQNMPTDFVDSNGLNKDDGIIRVHTWTWKEWDSYWGADNGGHFDWLYDPIYPTGDFGGGGPLANPTPCAKMAARAQRVWGEVLHDTIVSASDPYVSFNRSALPWFDLNFNTWYTGHVVDGSIDSLGYFRRTHGGKNSSGTDERGQQDFRNEFLDSDYPRDSSALGADQVHHFAAYFSAGLNGAALSSYYHDLSDSAVPLLGRGGLGANRGDLDLGKAAYDLGAKIAANPNLMARIGDLIKQQFCN